MENQLKQDMEAQMPFISEVLETAVVASEYAGTNFEASFGQLI